MKVKVAALSVLIVLSTPSFGFSFQSPETEKLQYIADANKSSPNRGAILYQIDAYYSLHCSESASLNQLKNLEKTRAFKYLVIASKKNELIGINSVSNTFKEFEEEPKCKKNS
ncbi:hypothetical protein ACOJUY_004245 [Vibrio alginolyticus]|uniref:hypothetical protein n=1 Tax=Vibrio diabolicus TaxID=50719 RepID=UPI00211C20BE|nr:hypothetical protein [Vibrio diabolicus]EGQ8101723.1 hypothetical protein [Vibrio parahaemolyticus]MCQ9247902.1 hypothetical protein [Vibrio diabolicus]